MASHASLEDQRCLINAKANVDGHDLTGDRVALRVDGRSGYIVEFLQHALHFCRVDLVAADVDDLAVPSADAQPFAIDINLIARIEKAVCVERV